jgi:3-hydroxybutyryl-CoA dehydratase
VANRLPGPGTIYLGQNLSFRAPVRPGDTVHATVRVKEVVREKDRVVLEAICRVCDKVVIDGEALVMTTSRVRRMAERAAAHASVPLLV